MLCMVGSRDFLDLFIIIFICFQKDLILNSC